VTAPLSPSAPDPHPYVSIASLLRAGLIWPGSDHDVHARPFLPIDRGAVLARIAEGQDIQDRRDAAPMGLGGVEPLGYSGELVPA
jgi:hypothetical protein